MTKEELLRRLWRERELSEDDAEAAHSNADYLLLEFIADKEISEAFKRIERWYA